MWLCLNKSFINLVDEMGFITYISTTRRQKHNFITLLRIQFYRQLCVWNFILRTAQQIHSVTNGAFIWLLYKPSLANKYWMGNLVVIRLPACNWMHDTCLVAFRISQQIWNSYPGRWSHRIYERYMYFWRSNWRPRGITVGQLNLC